MRNRIQVIQKANQETRPERPKLVIQEGTDWKVRWETYEEVQGIKAEKRDSWKISTGARKSVDENARTAKNKGYNGGKDLKKYRKVSYTIINQ